jgi:alkyl sulfatase BDS1-like metallo-beta-lactamase superfamily hydrolase
MSAPTFASSADLGEKQQTLEILADGVYALTAEGDPNIGAIEGEDFLVCFEALATPTAAREWLTKLREHTEKPPSSRAAAATMQTCGNAIGSTSPPL